MLASLQTLAPSIAESQAIAARRCPMCRKSIGSHPYGDLLACIRMAAERPCTTCGGYGQQDDGETRFPCRSCHCRECGEKLSKQFGWCVNLKCDASKAVA